MIRSTCVHNANHGPARSAHEHGAIEPIGADEKAREVESAEVSIKSKPKPPRIRKAIISKAAGGAEMNKTRVVERSDDLPRDELRVAGKAW